MAWVLRLPQQKTKSGSSVTESIDVDSGEESDGQGALRAVEADEAAVRKGNKRGPLNHTTKHWLDPIPIWEGKSPRWQFTCRYCKA